MAPNPLVWGEIPFLGIWIDFFTVLALDSGAPVSYLNQAFLCMASLCREVEEFRLRCGLEGLERKLK